MGDREDSPDWLRNFQPPSRSITTLSSGSDASAPLSPASDCSLDDDDFISKIIPSSTKTSNKQVKIADQTPPKRADVQKLEGGTQDSNDVEMEECSDKPVATTSHNHSVWALSSDSESDSKAAIRDKSNDEEATAPKVFTRGRPPKKLLKLEKGKFKEKIINSPVKLEESLKEEEKENDNKDTISKVVRKRKSPKKKSVVEDVEPSDNNQAEEPFKMEEEVSDIVVADKPLPENPSEAHVGSSRLALVFPEKVSRSKALVQCEGESIDLSGDMGAVGRVIISDSPSGEPEMFLDLKGTIYKTAIIPSRTFCVVSIGQSEAKIEAIMNDFIELKPQSNVYDAETMVEGTLEGFSFGSDDEADKTTKDVKADQNEEDAEPTAKKARGKAEKKSGATQKKGKVAGVKQPAKRKPQATKKSKTKK